MTIICTEIEHIFLLEHFKDYNVENFGEYLKQIYLPHEDAYIKLHSGKKGRKVEITSKNNKNIQKIFEQIISLLSNKKCFFAMEYIESNNEIYFSIKKYLFNKKRIRTIRIDEEPYSGLKDNQLEEEMDQADLAIVNTSYNNINVIYELGYLTSKLGKDKIIIISDNKFSDEHAYTCTGGDCCKYKSKKFNFRQRSTIFLDSPDFLIEIEGRIKFC
ncbi:hypothetical protein [Spiroplasma endosymbiont of Clivina fossor]|uniref:hypothetical protein n=1 Tax=Spiroplasma endosymbiont of Clivina fossor TaxID=3066282 RepID=UPI00313B6C55